MPQATTNDLIREMRDAHNHRLRMVQHARQHGIKPTARAFATRVPTVGPHEALGYLTPQEFLPRWQTQRKERKVSPIYWASR